MATLFTAGLLLIGLLRTTVGKEHLLKYLALWFRVLKWVQVHDPAIHRDSQNLEQFEIAVIQHDTRKRLKRLRCRMTMLVIRNCSYELRTFALT